MGSNRNPLTKEEVIEAAIACMERFGVAKTSIKDVAEALGVTRQTVHRLFETRTELLEAVADVRIAILAKQLVKEFAKFATFEDAVVEGSLVSLAAGRSDPILVEIQQRADHSVDQYMFQGSPQVQSVMVDLWGPMIERSQADGTLRADLSIEQIVEWIRNVHAMLNMRDDYSDDDKRAMLRHFVAPSLRA